MAARGSVPSKLTKNVSTRPKLIIITMPMIIGTVIRFNIVATLPCVKLEARVLFFDSVTSVSLLIRHEVTMGNKTGLVYLSDCPVARLSATVNTRLIFYSFLRNIFIFLFDRFWFIALSVTKPSKVRLL